MKWFAKVFVIFYIAKEIFAILLALFAVSLTIWFMFSLSSFI